jgi:hypothetical protein
MVPSIFVAALGHPRINRIYMLDNLGINWPKGEWLVWAMAFLKQTFVPDILND